MPIIFISLQTEIELMLPCLKSGSLGFLWHIHGWLPVNVDAVRGQAGDDRLKIDPHPKLPGLQTQHVKETLDFPVEFYLHIFGN